MNHGCHEVHCRNVVTHHIVGVIPAVSFADGTTAPSQGERLLGFTCRKHVEDTVRYFTRCGHADVQAHMAWERRAERHLYIQQRVSALLAKTLGSAYGIDLQWGWLEPEPHIRRAAEAEHNQWIQAPLDGNGMSFSIWRACANAHWRIEKLNNQTPYFHPDAPAYLSRAYADLSALDQ